MEHEEDTGAPSVAAIDDLPAATVPVDSLVAAVSPRRLGVDATHARLLADAPGPLPPVVVHRPTMRVIDGMHRVRAARLRGDTEIEVRFFSGDEAEAFVLAVQLNTAHGLPLSLPDRKAAADRILGLHPDWSDRVIASVTGLSKNTVAARRRRPGGQNDQVHTRTGRDKRTYPAAGAAQRRETAARLLEENPDASLREVARRAGVSPETVRQVRAGLAAGRGQDPPRDDQPQPQAGLPADQAPPGRRNATTGTSAQAAGTAVAALIGDPAFRSTDNGRALLRLFTATRAVHDRGGTYLDGVPPHCLSRLADAARSCAQEWQAFAEDVDRRRHRQDEGSSTLAESLDMSPAPSGHWLDFTVTRGISGTASLA